MDIPPELEPATGLSPSSLDLWLQCPRKYRKEKLERRVGSPSGIDAVLGSYVHRVLEVLMTLAPSERTAENARVLMKPCWGETVQSTDWEALALSPDEATSFRRKAWASVRKYFEIEDPAKIDVIATERRIDAVVNGVPMRGIIDRLEADIFGDLVITDYKGLDRNTPLPTPDGWTTMAAVQVGDSVFGVDGHPCRVTGKSEIHHRDCYRVSFDDGTNVIADAVHLWAIEKDSGPMVLSTVELANNLTSEASGQRDCRIPMPAPLVLPTVQTAADPWLLGYWLGNGKHTSGEVTWGDPTVMDVMAERGHEIRTVYEKPDSKGRTATVLGLRTYLREIDLLGNKHVPTKLLRGDRDQRLALLQGFMDSDGSWNSVRNQAVFVNLDKGLASAVMELALSLGQRVSWWEGNGSGYGKIVHQYRVSFTPRDINPFLTSKGALLDNFSAPTKAGRRVVTSVEPVPSVPTQCIEVDAPDSLYLCGEQMVPTHNSGKVPPPIFRGPKLRQLNIYAALVEADPDPGPTQGKLPTEGRLVFTSFGKTITTTIDRETVGEAVEVVTNAWEDIGLALASDEFEPQPGPLCGWCPFVAECPEGLEDLRDRRARGKLRVDAPAYPLAAPLPEPVES